MKCRSIRFALPGFVKLFERRQSFNAEESESDFKAILEIGLAVHQVRELSEKDLDWTAVSNAYFRVRAVRGRLQ